MTETLAEAGAVIVERELPHPQEKVWRALTQGDLIEAWLMKNDFEPVIGHRFHFTAEWGAVECRVMEVEPNRTLSYSWCAYGLESVVTWTLTPTPVGTCLRMEQAGFRADQTRAYAGAQAGWARFFAGLERVLAQPQ
jgi:uncharacterized protein YndB with AHSA1/START domain